MNLRKLIGQLEDPSPQVKLKVLKEMDTIKDYTVYSVDVLLELDEKLSEYKEYFNPSVQMFALRIHDRVSAILTEKMKESPESMAKEAALALLDGLDDEEQGEEKRRFVPPTQKKIEKSGNDKKRGVKQVSSPQKRDEKDVVVDFSVIDKRETKKNEVVETVEKKVEKRVEDRKTVESKVVNPEKQKKKGSKPKSSGPPKMVIVFSEEEGKWSRAFNTLFALFIFLLTFGIAFKELGKMNDVAYGLLGFGILFTIAFFTPTRRFTAYNKARLAGLGFVAITGYIYYKYGFSYDFGFSQYVPPEFRSHIFFKNLNENITKIVLFLWLFFPTFFVITDRTPVIGTKMFVMFLFLYSSLAMVEALYFREGIDTMIGGGKFFDIINPPFLRPIFFGVNIFYPIIVLIVVFAMLQHLFSLSFNKLLSSLLVGIMALGASAVVLFHLRISPYPNIADFFWPRTLETYKENLSTGIYNSIIAGNNVESKLVDLLAVENGKIVQGKSDGTGETKIQPEILIPENGIDPSLSPNGLYLAFAQTDGKKSDIKFMRLQSREIVPLVSDN